MSDTQTDGSGVVGQQGLNDAEHPFNTHMQFIDQALGKIGTIKLVKIMGVSEIGGLGPVGFVDVKIMTNLVDGVLGSSSEHDTTFHLPYFRIQGGKNAVIMDPAEGDIGAALICDRDISSVKNNRAVSNPGSFRRFSIADGLYIGGYLNDTPTQYIQFTDNGITIKSGSGGINLNGLTIDTNGNVQTPGGATYGVGGADQVTAQHHTHPANGSPPSPGT